MHPLDGAYKRVERASIHLGNLNRHVRTLSKTINDSITSQKYPKPILLPDGSQAIGDFSIKLPTVSHTIKIIVGEIIYNLRSALDYLVYELARLDSSDIKNSTQFPIESTVKGFKGKRDTFLNGVSDEHVAIFERLQPYKGCDWTKLIRELSNPDKHRQLVITRVSTTYNIAIKDPSAETLTHESPMNMDNSATIQIIFSAGGIPVTIDTLKQLKTQVTETLDAFKPDFK